MDAIELLKQQHKKTKTALETLEKGNASPAALKQLANELVAHMVIEEHVFYPRVRELMKDMVGESFEEHTVARFALARALTAAGEARKARITVLKELIEHHVEEEEKEMFPKVKKEVEAAELERLGKTMETMFTKAVDMGFEALVRGDAQELRTLGGSMNGQPQARRASRTMRATR